MSNSSIELPAVSHPIERGFHARKRVLLVDLGGSMGGVESYLQSLTRLLKEHVEIHALCALPELARRLQLEDAKVHQMPLFAGALKPLRFLLALFLLPVLVLWQRIQIVQLNGFLESILILPARLLGCQVIYTRHGPFEDDLYTWYKSPLRFFPRLASRLCVRLASHVICVSESVREVVRQSVREDRLSVISNWVSTIPAYRPAPARLPLPARLLFVGRLERYKGLHLLLEAMRSVPETTLTVLGDGNYRTELEGLASGMPVTFEGFASHPARYYAECDIFVMPSLGPEGLPMVTLEAMAQGLPCLFSDLPVHREITADGKAGLLFRSGDAGDLKEKLLAILHSDAVRVNLSREAYRMVKAKYNAETALKSYLCAFGL